MTLLLCLMASAVLTGLAFLAQHLLIRRPAAPLRLRHLVFDQRYRNLVVAYKPASALPSEILLLRELHADHLPGDMPEEGFLPLRDEDILLQFSNLESAERVRDHLNLVIDGLLELEPPDSCRDFVHTVDLSECEWLRFKRNGRVCALESNLHIADDDSEYPQDHREAWNHCIDGFEALALSMFASGLVNIKSVDVKELLLDAYEAVRCSN